MLTVSRIISAVLACIAVMISSICYAVSEDITSGCNPNIGTSMVIAEKPGIKNVKYSVAMKGVKIDGLKAEGGEDMLFTTTHYPVSVLRKMPKFMRDRLDDVMYTNIRATCTSRGLEENNLWPAGGRTTNCPPGSGIVVKQYKPDCATGVNQQTIVTMTTTQVEDKKESSSSSVVVEEDAKEDLKDKLEKLGAILGEIKAINDTIGANKDQVKIGKQTMLMTGDGASSSSSIFESTH